MSSKRNRVTTDEEKHGGHDGYHVKRRRTKRDASITRTLPFSANPLHKDDLRKYRPLFADYLDVQKQLDIRTLSQDVVRGRWKSFVRKWNQGELVEGWYDPEAFIRARDRSPDPQFTRLAEGRQQSEDEDPGYVEHRSPSPDIGDSRGDDNEEDDELGPNLPATNASRSGPTIPNFQDLQQRREDAEDDKAARRADRKHERKQEIQQRKERLEELEPRADPGTRERQLEKRRATTAVNREFRDAKEGQDMEIGESDLMGGDDGVDEYKARMRTRERQKNEREIRKEEVLRARQAEREQRLKVSKAKEEQTIEMLRALASKRFGAG